MDIRQTLLDTEMIMKDFISMIISENWGKNWMSESGLTDSRLKELNQVRLQYEEEFNPLTTEGRLLNYCNFLDLSEIISAHWNNQFEVAFGEFDNLRAYLKTLQKFQNPDAFNRPLLSFEKHFILGVTGTIRNNIAIYRTWKEVGKEGFPIIDSVQDNFANLWTMGSPKKLRTQLSLSIGDQLEFIVLASHPQDEDLEFKLFRGKWQTGNVIQYEIKPSDLGKDMSFHIGIRGKQKHHAYPLGHDDKVTFEYTILPAS